MDRANVDLLARFCAAHPEVALFDEATATLLDVSSGKSLRLPLAALQQAVEKRTHDRNEPYLVLLLDDGRQLALAPAGVAFPPDTRSAGPLPGLPAVVCWRDFSSVIGHAEHVLAAHPEERPGRELLDLLRYCVALLDGARAAGFETGAEEARLERALGEVERRKRG
jgi:hypothetical protein